MDPHGYHPMSVDESILTNQERRAALKESFQDEAAGSQAPDLTQYLTREELSAYEMRLRGPEVERLSFSLPQSGQLLFAARLRRYARQKYNHGKRLWCGDGPPPWRRITK